MTKTRKATVRLKLGKRGFHFLQDGSVNAKKTCYYTRKDSAIVGVRRFMGTKPYKLVDETGVSYRGNPKAN